MAPTLPDLNVFTDKRGRERMTWPGRKGFPIMLRKGEAPEEAYTRVIATEAAKAVTSAGGPAAAPAPAPPAAGKAKVKGSRWRRPGPKASEPATAASPDPQPAAEERARPKGSDPKPRGGRPIGKPRATTAELEAVLAEVLVLPAIPMGFPVRDPLLDQVQDLPGGGQRLIPGLRPRCEYCRDHFLKQGPLAAAELAKMAESSEPLRALLERLHSAWSMLSVGSVLAGYVAQPMLHHVAPEAVLDSMGPVFGVPPRPPKPPPTHDHGHGHAAGTPTGSNGAGPAAPGASIPGASAFGR